MSSTAANQWGFPRVGRPMYQCCLVYAVGSMIIGLCVTASVALLCYYNHRRSVSGPDYILKDPARGDIYLSRSIGAVELWQFGRGTRATFFDPPIAVRGNNVKLVLPDWSYFAAPVSIAPNPNPFAATPRHVELAIGWPLLAFCYSNISHGAATRPIRPIWSGLVMNVTVYCIITTLLTLSARAARRRVRTIQHRCIMCGYPLVNVPGCSECGYGRTM